MPVITKPWTAAQEQRKKQSHTLGTISGLPLQHPFSWKLPVHTCGRSSCSYGCDPKPRYPGLLEVAFGLPILFCFLAPKVHSPPVPEIHETPSCPYQSPYFFVAASDEFLTSKTLQKQKKRTPLITGHLYFLLIFKQTFHTQKSNQVKTNEIK